MAIIGILAVFGAALLLIVAPIVVGSALATRFERHDR